MARLELRRWLFDRWRTVPVWPLAIEQGLPWQATWDRTRQAGASALAAPARHADLCADADCAALDESELFSRIRDDRDLLRAKALELEPPAMCDAAVRRLFEDAVRAVIVEELPAIRERMAEAEGALHALPQYAGCRDDPALPELTRCEVRRAEMARQVLDAAAAGEVERIRSAAVDRLEPIDFHVGSLADCPALAAFAGAAPSLDFGRRLEFATASATLDVVRSEMPGSGGAERFGLLLVNAVDGHLSGTTDRFGIVRAGGGEPSVLRPDPYRTAEEADLVAGFGCALDRDRVAAMVADGIVVHAVVPAERPGHGWCVDDGIPDWTAAHELAMALPGDGAATGPILVLTADVVSPSPFDPPGPPGWWVVERDERALIVSGDGPRPVMDEARLWSAIRPEAGGGPNEPATAGQRLRAPLVPLEIVDHAGWGWIQPAVGRSEEPVPAGGVLRCGGLSFLALVGTPPQLDYPWRACEARLETGLK
ncbi:MAG: hypothetical protein HY907_15830 [Deltaproteobacteria bacterium]|nr:hypothetical protein [Deltaproteobacteria bacterium]